MCCCNVPSKAEIKKAIATLKTGKVQGQPPAEVRRYEHSDQLQHVTYTSLFWKVQEKYPSTPPIVSDHAE